LTLHHPDRPTGSVNAGSNGGTAWTRPVSVPASSATLLVTQYTYNSAGWVYDVIDPMGIDTRTNYDNLGRIIETIQDDTNGTETSESNITTSYNYDGNNNVINVHRKRCQEPFLGDSAGKRKRFLAPFFGRCEQPATRQSKTPQIGHRRALSIRMKRTSEPMFTD
jgi:YD repeat-containing protein